MEEMSSGVGSKLSAKDYFGEYYGHRVEDLEVVEQSLRYQGKAQIFLAGDSSLDNKFWFNKQCVLKNGYENVMHGRGKPDIAHHLNVEALRRRLPLSAVNCAVEEARVESRACGTLLDQDAFVRDHIKEEDTLVVSVGGNDIALRPTIFTVLNMLALVLGTRASCVDSCACGCAVPVDDCCMGGACGCLSSLLAWPCGMGYFIHLFQVRITAYIQQMIARRKPKRVIVCMIYYPHEQSGGSWADTTLSLLGYNRDPQHLQAIIRAIFRLATQRISIPGTTIIGLPLYECLDSTNANHYCQRVEPSPDGGALIAARIMDIVQQHEEEDAGVART
jgi:hypothetical protein